MAKLITTATTHRVQPQRLRRPKPRAHSGKVARLITLPVKNRPRYRPPGDLGRRRREHGEGAQAGLPDRGRTKSVGPGSGPVYGRPPWLRPFR
jgi:hypothetical protein